jgi:hypothetical protein
MTAVSLYTRLVHTVSIKIGITIVTAINTDRILSTGRESCYKEISALNRNIWIDGNMRTYYWYHFALLYQLEENFGSHRYTIFLYKKFVLVRLARKSIKVRKRFSK